MEEGRWAGALEHEVEGRRASDPEHEVVEEVWRLVVWTVA